MKIQNKKLDLICFSVFFVIGVILLYGEISGKIITEYPKYTISETQEKYPTPAQFVYAVDTKQTSLEDYPQEIQKLYYKFKLDNYEEYYK